MFDNDPIIRKEIIAFVIVTALGTLSYAAATLAARFISPVPRHLYIGRIVFLAVFILLIFSFYLPSMAVAFSGDRIHAAERMIKVRGMGTAYGMHTLWIWIVLALLKWPRNRQQTGRFTG